MNILRHARLAALVALGLLVGAIGGALGQAGWNQIISPAGTEMLQAFIASSAYQNFVTVNQVRNTTGYTTSTQTTGTLATTAVTDDLLLTAAVTTMTVNVPASPPDAQLFSIVNATGSAFVGTITVASTDGSTFVGGGTSIVNLGSAASQEWQYTIASRIWYRIR